MLVKLIGLFKINTLPKYTYTKDFDLTVFIKWSIIVIAGRYERATSRASEIGPSMVLFSVHTMNKMDLVLGKLT